MKRTQSPTPRANPAASPNRELADLVADIDRTRRDQKCFPRARPKRAGELMAQLLARRGYAQVQAAGEVIAAWEAAVGAKLAPYTRIGVLRAGTLTVVCDTTGVLQELLFQKESLLARLNEQLAPKKLKDLRLRAGVRPPA